MMKNCRSSIVSASLFCVVLAVAAITGCAEEGNEGIEALNCGDHGTEHDGHCHCDDGYLYDGSACVTPGEITAVCGEEHEGEEHEGEEHEGEEHHHHAACRCPDTGACPCDEGTLETLDLKQYCLPELHAN